MGCNSSKSAERADQPSNEPKEATPAAAKAEAQDASVQQTETTSTDATAEVESEDKEAAGEKEDTYDWVKLHDADSDKCYYFNTTTGESVWDKPANYKKPRRGSISVHESKSLLWVEIQDIDTKAYYYFNTQTGESVWERPADYVLPERGSLTEMIALQFAARAASASGSDNPITPQPSSKEVDVVKPSAEELKAIEEAVQSLGVKQLKMILKAKDVPGYETVLEKDELKALVVKHLASLEELNRLLPGGLDQVKVEIEEATSEKQVDEDGSETKDEKDEKEAEAEAPVPGSEAIDAAAVEAATEEASEAAAEATKAAAEATKAAANAAAEVTPMVLGKAVETAAEEAESFDYRDIKARFSSASSSSTPPKEQFKLDASHGVSVSARAMMFTKKLEKNASNSQAELSKNEIARLTAQKGSIKALGSQFIQKAEEASQTKKKVLAPKATLESLDENTSFRKQSATASATSYMSKLKTNQIEYNRSGSTISKSGIEEPGMVVTDTSESAVDAMLREVSHRPSAADLRQHYQTKIEIEECVVNRKDF